MNEPKNKNQPDTDNPLGLDEKTAKEGKRIAKWVMAGFAAWIAIYFLENFILVPPLIFWLVIGFSTVIGALVDLIRADFKLMNISWSGGRQTTYDSAFDENENLKLLPKIGISFGVLVVNFLSHGWILILLLMGLNFIPAAKVEKVEYPVYKQVSNSSLRAGKSTKFYFECNGYREHFTIAAETYIKSRTIKFRTYKGLLGFRVIQRRLGS
jgi:hypothetical protein